MPKSVLIVLRCAPFGKSIAHEAFRIAIGFRGGEVNTSILLIEDGVFCLLKHQEGSIYKMMSLVRYLSEMDEFEIKLYIHKPSLEKRRIKKGNLIDIGKLIDDEELKNILDSHDSIMFF
ncbi:MAG: DsrE family protein [Synergistetes bacterium]|nr:DsrE family protein [Synergistota bacterium]